MKHITLLGLFISFTAFSGPLDGLKDKAKAIANDEQKQQNAKVELEKAKETAKGAMDSLKKEEKPAETPVATASQKPLPKKKVKKAKKK